MLSLKDKTAGQNSISSATLHPKSFQPSCLHLQIRQLYIRVLQTRDLKQKLLVSEPTLKLEKEVKSPFKNNLWVLLLQITECMNHKNNIDFLIRNLETCPTIVLLPRQNLKIFPILNSPISSRSVSHN